MARLDRIRATKERLQLIMVKEDYDNDVRVRPLISGQQLPFKAVTFTEQGGKRGRVTFDLVPPWNDTGSRWVYVEISSQKADDAETRGKETSEVGTSEEVRTYFVPAVWDEERGEWEGRNETLRRDEDDQPIDEESEPMETS